MVMKTDVTGFDAGAKAHAKNSTVTSIERFPPHPDLRNRFPIVLGASSPSSRAAWMFGPALR